MSSTTQSTDYKSLGVQYICKIKEAYKGNNYGQLTKTLSRKIYEIIEDAIDNNKDLKSTIPDLAYLAARNGGLNQNTELGAFINEILRMINNNIRKEDIVSYLQGAVMAIYVIETAEDEEIDYKPLLCR
ncbi:hypothetical protein [Acidianus manzaensis]|uniref:hypothetical protein n=1 Tax=Acidianus manzaensis TaxID=282676 RepID=UPI0011E5DB65|nr:hypothetical protein [Acidianus manzaensis]